jgi:sulfotransferase famil protein
MNSQSLDSKRNNSPIYRKIFSFYWSFPYEARKTIFHLVMPTLYGKWQDLRQNNQVDKDEYSLASFDRNKCIFVHIPKCAGVSITQSLFGNRAGGHKTIVQYQLIFSAWEFNTYFKFTIVRNPWDRLISAYTFLKQGGLTEDDHVWADQNLSDFPDFHSFVINWVNHRNIYTYFHFVPQHEFLLDPKTQKLGVDFIGKFENLEKDYEKICAKLNISASLLKQNKTTARFDDYRKYYDEQTRNIVTNVYQKDIELFGYMF